jgi:hypothetical protein
MRYTWLAEVLRDAGLTVHEVSGWKTRGSNSFGPVRGITCHHTAGSRNSSDEGELNVLINGRPGLPGPISQLYLSRSGEWWTVAAGHCNHNLTGWAGPNKGYGNDSLLGIEAQHSGGDEPWTARQYDSYVRGVHALVHHNASGWSVSVDRVAGHKEHQPGAKSDPTFSMPGFRADVRAYRGEWDEMATEAQVQAAVEKAIKKATKQEVLDALQQAVPYIGSDTSGPRHRIGVLAGWGDLSVHGKMDYLLELIANVKVEEDGSKTGNTIFARIDRIEKAIEELRAQVAELAVGPTTGARE